MGEFNWDIFFNDILFDENTTWWTCELPAWDDRDPITKPENGFMEAKYQKRFVSVMKYPHPLLILSQGEVSDWIPRV